jgi:hypothetical protein
MAWTYTTLNQAIQDTLETDETTFVTNIPVFVKQAEDRILKQVQLPDFRKNVAGVTAASDQYLGVPTDFLAPYSLAVDNTGYEYLLFKDANFVREAYPANTTEGVPKYYGLFDDTFFIMGPTPDAIYNVELHYFYKPESIVTASTSWLGTHAERALLKACIVEGYTFLKGDDGMLELYESQFQDSLANLKILGEGRNVTDSYRSA